MHSAAPADFVLIMRRHNQRLFRVARSILKNDADAEEAVQEAYLKAFRNLDEFAGDAGLGTWLTRIVINEALGRRRRRRAVVELDALAVSAAEAVMSEEGFLDREVPEDPEQFTARAEARVVLEQAIDSLAPAFRVVFVMRAVEQMSTAETARALGIPEDTVRTRFHRARRRLRELLSEQIAVTAPDAFTFAGDRCDRIVAAVADRLNLNPQQENDR